MQSTAAFIWHNLECETNPWLAIKSRTSCKVISAIVFTPGDSGVNFGVKLIWATAGNAAKVVAYAIL
jgi:hypothetical protein